MLFTFRLLFFSFLLILFFFFLYFIFNFLYKETMMYCFLPPPFDSFNSFAALENHAFYHFIAINFTFETDLITRIWTELIKKLSPTCETTASTFLRLYSTSSSSLGVTAGSSLFLLLSFDKNIWLFLEWPTWPSVWYCQHTSKMQFWNCPLCFGKLVFEIF